MVRDTENVLTKISDRQMQRHNGKALLNLAMAYRLSFELTNLWEIAAYMALQSDLRL